MQGATQGVQAGVRDGGREARGQSGQEGVGWQRGQMPEEEGRHGLQRGRGVKEVEQEEGLGVREWDV